MKRRKKVLFLIHTLGAGGAERVLVNLVNNMSSDYEITLMTVIDTGVFRKNLNPNITYKTMFKIPFGKKEKNNESGSLLNKTSKTKSFLAKSYSFLWKYMPVKSLYKNKIKENYDIEVAFLEGICAKIISASNQDSKKFAWMHVDVINENKSDKVFKNIKEAKKCYQKFDKIIAVSEEVKKQFTKKYDYDKNQVVVKHNAISKEEILKKAEEKIEWKKRPFEIVTVGRLSKQKGYDRLLEIVKKLKVDKIEFHLSIIGVGPKEEELKEYIKENNIEDYVSFLGFQKNPYPYMKNADLFVCSSRAEGFSTVACEAAILSVPIVTTDCSGMKELLGDSEYGLITENNTESLYNGLKSILTDNELYEKYKEQILKIKDKFSIEKSVKEIEEMFGD